MITQDLLLDPLAVAAGLSTGHGTVLLHAQRAWQGQDTSWLLFDPVWELRVVRGEILERGPVPILTRPAPSLPERLEQLRASAGVVAGGTDEEFPLLAGVLGYDLGAGYRGCRHTVEPGFDLPDAWFGCFDAALAFGPGRPARLLLRGLANDEVRPARKRELLERIRAAALRLPPEGGKTGEPRLPDPDWHRGAVHRIQDFLRAGDSYQVNLTAFARAETSASPFGHFLRHSAENPTSFAAFLRIDETSISSHSPESLLRVVGSLASTGPIKGTAEQSDGARGWLVASEKDLAEHLMIVDLCRNDLGRRAEPGTVSVTGLMESLSVRDIEHMVSRIEARVRKGGRGGLLESMFPGGSITGAPKRRSMEIITEVETTRRGPYTGSIGWIRPDGDMDFNIAIRTAVWQDETVAFGCGGGIVLDSDPAAEYDEATLKARAFLRTLTGKSA